MNAGVAPDPDPGQPELGSTAPAAATGAAPRGDLLPIALCALLPLAGAASVLWYLKREARAMHLTDAIESSERFAVSVTQFRNFYSEEIVPRARQAGMPITHA
jgi:hypothetical protein